MVMWFLTQISQLNEKKVIFPTNGGRLRGMLWGPVAEPGSPDRPQLEVSGASRGRGPSSSLGSRGCLDDVPSVTSIPVWPPSACWERGVCLHAALQDALLCGLKTDRVVGNQAHSCLLQRRPIPVPDSLRFLENNWRISSARTTGLIEVVSSQESRYRSRGRCRGRDLFPEAPQGLT